jgi:hypothetical protein
MSKYPNFEDLFHLVQQDAIGSHMFLWMSEEHRSPSSLDSVTRCAEEQYGGNWARYSDEDHEILLCRCLGRRSLISMATTVRELLGNGRMLRLAASSLAGWQTNDFGDVWERARGAVEILRHPLNRIEFGEYDLRMQHLGEFDQSRDSVIMQLAARELFASGATEDAGFLLFESFASTTSRGRWMSKILDSCLDIVPAFRLLEGTRSLALDPGSWGSSRDHFANLRSEVMKGRLPPSLKAHALYVAEICSKVMYNESMCPMPFDRDSGWSMAEAVLGMVRAAQLDDRQAEEILFGPLADF